MRITASTCIIFIVAQMYVMGATATCTDPPMGSAENLPYQACTSIGGVNGWAAMTNDGAQSDQFSCSLTGEESNRGNSVIHTDASKGNQSWHFKRGYDSAGTGTACSPQFGLDTSSVVGGMFEYSIDFKSADDTCQDGSRIAIIPAPCDCSDRSNEYLEVQNLPGYGLEVRSYGHDNQTTWTGNYISHTQTPLECNKWHNLHCKIVEEKQDGGKGSVVTTCYLDDVKLNMGLPYFTTARNIGNFDFAHSCRIKFQPRHANYDASFQGFKLDNLKVIRKDKGSQIISSYEIGFENINYEVGASYKGTSSVNCPHGDYFSCTNNGMWISDGPQCNNNNQFVSTCSTVKDAYKKTCCNSTSNKTITLEK